MTAPDYFGKDSLEHAVRKIFNYYGYGVSALNLIKNIGIVSEKSGLKLFLIGGFPRDVIIYILKLKAETAANYKFSEIFKNNHGLLDLDIAVEGNAEKLACLIKEDKNLKSTLNSLKIHKRFGTALTEFSVNDKPLKIDFASFRTEIYAKSGMLPEVDMSAATLKSDIFRRDFTINTLAFSINSANFFEIKNYSSGISDILNKKIKVLHNLSFIDDPTRIFRAVRFEKRLTFHMDRKTLKLIKTAIEKKVMDNVSGKRITAELYLLFKENSPEIYFERLEKLNILSSIYIKLKFLKKNKIIFKRIRRYFNNEICKDIDVKIFYIAGFFYGLSEYELREAAERLNLGNKIEEDIKKFFSDINKINSLKINNTGIYDKLNKINYKSILFYLFEDEGKEKADLNFRKIIVRYLEKTVSAKPFLNGNDIKSLGVCEGPLCGKILNEVKLLKIAGKLKYKEDEIEYVKSKYLEYLKK